MANSISIGIYKKMDDASSKTSITILKHQESKFAKKNKWKTKDTARSILFTENQKSLMKLGSLNNYLTMCQIREGKFESGMEECAEETMGPNFLNCHGTFPKCFLLA